MKYLLIITIILSALQAAPARPGERTFKQSDGTTFLGQAKGNQHLNWIESASGDILKYNSDTKNYEIAEIKDNQLKASGVKYGDNTAKAKGLNTTKLNKEDVYMLWSQKQQDHRLKMGYDKKHEH